MIKVDYKTFKKIFIFFYIFFFILILYFLRILIKPIVLSFVLAYILNPFVKLLVKKGLSKRNAVRICITILMLILFYILIYIIPKLIMDFWGIITNLNVYYDNFVNFLKGDAYNDLPQYLKGIIENSVTKLHHVVEAYINNILNKTMEITSGLTLYLLCPIFIYYFLADTDYFISLLKSIFPEVFKERTTKLISEIDMAIGNYIRGQILLSLLVAVMTFVVLFVSGIKYPTTLAILNGITNIIPYFGPVLGYIPAFITALTDSPKTAIIILTLLFLVQQVESMVIAPKILGDSMGIHPVMIIIILIIGGYYFGAWGLIFSVPVAGILKLSYKYLIKNLF